MTYIGYIDFRRPPGTAAAKAYLLDRNADAALATGQVGQAERLSRRAAELRESCHTPEQLAVHDERRLRLGTEHLANLGGRAVGCFVLQILHERRDIAGVLNLLDQWRETLTPGMVRAVGGDHWPACHVREAGR